MPSLRDRHPPLPGAMAAIVGLGLLLLTCAHGVARQPGEGTVAGTIDDPTLTEASGLAASRLGPAILWALNDGGNAAELHALAPDGRFLGAVQLPGVANQDWEDLASFERDGRAWLAVADVGDNGASRPEVALQVLAEPAAQALSPARALSAPVAYTVRLRLPVGPRDVEAVAVDGQEGRAYLVTKRTVPPLLFSVPLQPTPPDGEPVLARPEGSLDGLPRPRAPALSLPLPATRFRAQPTGMSFAPDGRAAAVLTYGEVYLFRRRPGQAWAEALSQAPELLGRHGLLQAEAIAFSGDGRAVYVTGEQPRPPLVRFELDQGAAAPAP